MLVALQIESTGKYLVLKPNGTITIEVHTTLFNSDGNFFGSFSYPFEMPLGPNRAALKNAHYINTSAKLRTIWVMIRLGPQLLPYKRVKMSFTIEDDTIQAQCYIDATLISAQLTNLMLWNLFAPPGKSTQVDYDELDGLAAYMKSTVTAAPGKMPMVFAPYRDNNAYQTPAGTVLALFDAGSYNAATNTPALHNNSGTGILPAIARGGWRYKCTASGTPDFGAGAVTVNSGDYVMFDGDTWYCPVGNPLGTRARDDAFPDLVFPLEPIINRWQMDALGNGSFLIDTVEAQSKQTQTPFFFAVVMLQRICDFFGYEMQGSVLNEDWFNRVVIWSRVAVNTVIADVAFFMPAISPADFIQELRTRCSVMVDFDATRMICVVESLQNLEATTMTVDLRALQIRSYRETTTTRTFYVISQDADSDDKAFPNNSAIPTLQIGDALTQDTETDITLISAATLMIEETAAFDVLLSDPVEAEWRIPEIDVPIWNEAPFGSVLTVTDADKNNFKLRLLFNHGMVPNSDGFEYPYISSDNLSIAGGIPTNVNIGLTPGDNDFSPMLHYYNFLIGSKPFEMGFELSIKKLLDMKANSRLLVKDPFNFATVSGIMDQLAADLQGDQKKIAAKITIYPIIRDSNTVQVIPAPIIIPPPPPFDNGLVYVRFTPTDDILFPEIIEIHPTEANSFFKDLIVTFFSDLAGTIPKSVTDLRVGYSVTETFHTDHDTVTGPFFDYVTCNGTSFDLQPGAAWAQNYTDGSGWSAVWVYAVLSSAYYTIIT